MTDFRAQTRAFLTAVLNVPEGGLGDFIHRHVAEDAVWDAAYPINRLHGAAAVTVGFFDPLRRAFTAVRRRDEIFIGGRSTRADGGDWAAALTHYTGNFEAPFAGIAPSGRLAFLRAGEFYRIENGKITEAKIIFDLPDLMRQAGRFPLPRILGTEMLFPGPATHDGVLPKDGGQGRASLDLVQAMGADLRKYDPVTFASKNQTGPDGYWHEDMLWYGPGGIGSNYRWEGFVKGHRASFLTAFADRIGGDHYCRIGDGGYAAFGGWPSMTMTHTGDYLGVAATGKELSLRVMDFYRCAEGKIMENWVLLDYVDLFQQMGVDLTARSEAAA